MGQLRPCLLLFLVIISCALGDGVDSDRDRVVDLQELLRDVSDGFKKFGEDMKQTLGMVTKSLTEFSKNMKSLNEVIVNGSVCGNKNVDKSKDDKDDKVTCKDGKDQDKNDKDNDDKDKVKDDKETDKGDIDEDNGVKVYDNAIIIDIGEQVQDCGDIYRKYGYRASGIYNIKPLGMKIAFPVYCNMNFHGGWTVIQQRGNRNPARNFSLSWLQYKNGFGKLTEKSGESGEFWLGNDRIAAITSQNEYKLWIDLWNHGHGSSYAEYSYFKIGNESTNFRLDIRGHSGGAGDALAAHNNQSFSTFDKNNNLRNNTCAEDLNNGGWWYGPCDSNLNGWFFQREHDTLGRGIKWSTWIGRTYSLLGTAMMIMRNAP